MQAAENGFLDESRWCELKKALPDGNRQSNKELARDLASLSVDGGVLVVGVADDGWGKAGKVTGTSLAALADRVGKIAISTVSPPLHVETHECPHPHDPSTGCLVVYVPASRAAPHMVSGHYWGRSDKGKMILADNAVAELMRRRQEFEADRRARLLAVERLDPLGNQLSGKGHLHLVLEPLGLPHRGAFTRDMRISQLLQESLTFEPTHHPSFRDLKSDQSLARGAVAKTWGPRQGPDEKSFMLAQMDDEPATLSIVCGPVTENRSITYASTTVIWHLIRVAYILEITHAALQAAALLGHQLAYHGQWSAGVRITRTSGTVVLRDGGVDFEDAQPYAEAEYLEVKETFSRVLAEDTQRVVDALLRPLIRGLGAEDIYLPYEHPRDIGKLSI